MVDGLIEFMFILRVDLTTGGVSLYNRPFTQGDWIENFQLCRPTFSHLCHLLSPVISKQHTNMRLSLSVEKCVALTLWFLATPGEYRAISNLFGIARCTFCVVIYETCSAIVEVLLKQYIHFPT